ncbi:MAG: hypothetical protein FWD78_04375 [Treponema sp.]|nr:hypothetical protein [Treponema sp.]
MISMINRFIMQSGLIHKESEYNGKTVLGFDTGLDSQAFAQSKMAQYITQPGTVVFPDGRKAPWKAEGVIEKPRVSNGTPTMVVWGADFPGISLDTVIRDSERDGILDAIRFYIKAMACIDGTVFSGAAGAFIVTEDSPGYPRGTILFLPERLAKRCIEAGGEPEVTASQQWIHPDLKGNEQTVFCAAVMIYTALTGGSPYLPKDGDTMRQDIREGVFIPLKLAAPGLDKKLDAMITDVLLPDKKRNALNKKPTADQLLQAIGEPGTVKSDSWYTAIDSAEKIKIETELEQFKKNKEFSVKTRRFVVRNTTIIVVCAAVVVCAALIVHGYIQRLAEMPNTRGMTPADVVSVYYGSFEKLDHEMMDACVSGKKAKIDIDMILNLYVISKTRQAYETTETSMTARDWLDRGSPPTNATVFGVTDLTISPTGGSEASGTVYLNATYKLWMPASFAGDDEDLPSDEELMSPDFMSPPPRSYSYSDDLQLSWLKDSWRITQIDRTVVR